MDKRWFITGTVFYLLIAFVIFPFVIGIPWFSFFESDAGEYSLPAQHLLSSYFYSFDGVHPFVEREPVMSFFLVPIYFFFGIENAVALAAVQTVLLFISAWFFCEAFAKRQGSRAAGICFLILLTSGSVLHTVFSAYRECLILSLLLFFSGLYLQYGKRPVVESMVMGLLLGLVILGYYSFVFFPVFLLAVWLRDKRPLRHFLVLITVSIALVSSWGLRNALHDGRFRIIDSNRTAVMWYVRGEQAERVHGLEPFRCLWSEYVSRNWDGRSDACSYNGLMHARWPQGFLAVGDFADAADAGKGKIMTHFPSYLWFSVFEILELHLPYLGGGWSAFYNQYASLTQLILAIGVLAGLLRVFDKRLSLFVAFAVYNTFVFILTDATPRYLLPVFFAYAALAGVGYDHLLKAFRKHFS